MDNSKRWARRGQSSSFVEQEVIIFGTAEIGWRQTEETVPIFSEQKKINLNS